MRRWTKTDFLILLVPMLALSLLGRAKGAEPNPSPLVMEGKFIQGGLVIGRAPAGTRISLDGKPVRLRADGRFLLGFGRDAAPAAKLVAILPNGQRLAQKITVKKRRYRVQRINGLPRKMVTPPPAVLARIRTEGAAIKQARLKDTDRAMFDTGFIWPAKGRISGVYGSQRILNGKPRRPHFGVDVAAPVGTRIVATADGTVRIAERDMYFTGGTVLIDHGYGLNSVYSHMKTVIVKTGDAVKQGDVIGTLGGTGRATGPHLDWRVNLFLTRLDPALLVPPITDEARSLP
ncbi:MAG: murein DD-endopeptidase MepM/ murein hydrolase activator NlpD [Alphaproteobacteria bacterium]|jgi:murein DD-endopeptidase MepM/ murein hydrolase activator NlpD